MENEKFQELVLQQLAYLAEGQQRLESVVGKIETRTETLEQGQARLEGRMENLEHKTDRIDSGLLKLETRMENEVIDKIRALFDDRETQNDRLDRIENKLDDMATDISYIAAKIAGSGKLAR